MVSTDLKHIVVPIDTFNTVYDRPIMIIGLYLNNNNSPFRA